MKKPINTIFLFLSLLLLSNGAQLDKIQSKQRKLEVSATLNFVKVYDLIYKDKKWTFKIEIEDELSNGANVLVDIIVVDKYDGITPEKASCL